MVDHPFRFAVWAQRPRPGKEWLALAERAERLGYGTLLVPDHLGSNLSPMVALGAAAAVTRSLRLGPYVLANDFRHPVLAAQEAATLDLLSNGRLELGIGAGYRRSDFRQLGMRRGAGRRIERLEEALPLIKRLLEGETVTHAGPHYRFERAELEVRPVQRPRPPIHIGAGGPRMLGLAAREADIVGLIPRLTSRGLPVFSDMDEAALARKVEALRQEAGARFEHLELSLYVGLAGVPGRGGPLRAIASAALGVVATVLDSPYALFGTVAGLRERLLRRRERLGISYYAVPAAAMDELAPLVESLAGS